MGNIPTEHLIQAKIQRLEELRKYQGYYGPHTPYPVIVEINDLEVELRQLLSDRKTHSTAAVQKGNSAKKGSKKNKPTAPWWQIWRMSQATFDAIITIAFIGFLFLLGTILLATYLNSQPNQQGLLDLASIGTPPPTLRPTFTPTIEGQIVSDLLVAEAAVSQMNLPPAVKEPTPIATPVPSLTPTLNPLPTETPVPTEPPPTDIPPPPLPPPVSLPATATLIPPPPPAPSFPFSATEQGNRGLQKTTYHVITIYIAVVSEGNIPMGGYKVIADNGLGDHIESDLSDWHWSATNCLDCGYIKQGNLKVDLGTFADIAWHLYLADANGTQLSEPVSFTYSADPAQWVWDFVIFKQKP